MLERCHHEAVANHQPGASLPAGYSYVSLIQDAAGDSRQWFLGELLSDRVRVYAVFNVIYSYAAVCISGIPVIIGDLNRLATCIPVAYA